MGEKYIEITVSDKSEYVVEGAKLDCQFGSHMTKIKMPYSHGAFLKEKPQLNVKDSKRGTNITGFKTCSKMLAPCTPMINTKWINLEDCKLKIGGEEALVKDAVLFCAVGGRIIIVDSGQ